MDSAHQIPFDASRTEHQRASIASQCQSARPSPSNGQQNEPHAPNPANSLIGGKSSLDLTQRLERKLAEYNASQNVFKRWLFEIASWLVSALCMAAIIGIYFRLNETHMATAETLLTLANILGKIASAALIVPTTEALGQLKWNWFHKSQAMWDFEIFDKASRGPVGAALLLFRTKGRSLAALGALLIVLLLAIDSFFQQVVLFPDQWSLHNQLGEIPRVLYYNPVYLLEYWRGFEVSILDKDLRPGVQEFLYNNGTQPITFGNGTRPEIPLSCPTSNCTWPDYETFAVCSQCTEVSDLLDIAFTCMNTTIDWSTHWEGPLQDIPYPNGTVCGHFLNATSTEPILLTGYVVNQTETGSVKQEALMLRTIPLTGFLDKVRYYQDGSVAFKDTRNPIYDSLVASAPDGVDSVYQDKAPLVHECVLRFCVQTLRSSYDVGRYREEVIASFYNTSSGPSPWDSWDIPAEQGGGTYIVYKENVTIKHPTPDPEYTKTTIFDSEYGADNITVSGIIDIYDDFFPCSFTVDNTSAVPRLRYKNYADGPSVRTLHSIQWQAPNNITGHLERMATAMTNGMRSSPSKEMLQGKAYYIEKYVLVRWEWLIFPLLLLLFSLVFLVSTIVKTAGDSATGAWKTSAMPTLIYGLPKETQGQLTSSSTWNSMEHTRKLRIRLLPNMGWRVSGQSQLSTSPQLPRPAVQGPRGWI